MRVSFFFSRRKRLCVAKRERVGCAQTGDRRALARQFVELLFLADRESEAAVAIVAPRRRSRDATALELVVEVADARGFITLAQSLVLLPRRDSSCS